jgi:hypothetical protein
VEKLKLWLPPSAFNPSATAMASSSVDLPVPFSPMMNVTSELKASVWRFFTAGMVKGYWFSAICLSRFNEISLR